MLSLDEVAGLKTHEAFLPGRNYADRPNVLARIKGKAGGRSLLFTSHVDTMDVGDDPDPAPVMLPKLQAGEFSYRIPMQIPRECKIEVYWQTMPGETQGDIEREFLEFLYERKNANPRLRNVEIRHEFSHRWIPGTQIPRNHALVRTVEQAAASVLGEAPVVTGAPFPCDMFLFHQYGFGSGVILGPDGANAHAADEYVCVEGLVKLAKIAALSAAAWCGTEDACT